MIELNHGFAVGCQGVNQLVRTSQYYALELLTIAIDPPVVLSSDPRASLREHPIHSPFQSCAHGLHAHLGVQPRADTTARRLLCSHTCTEARPKRSSMDTRSSRMARFSVSCWSAVREASATVSFIHSRKLVSPSARQRGSYRHVFHRAEAI